MPRAPPTSFQPHNELSRKMLMILKRPPTSQKMATTWIRTNSVAPGAVSRNRPMIAAAIPSSKTSHQGELVSSVPSTNAVTVVAPFFFLDFFLVEDFFLEASLCLTNVGATSSYNLQLTLLSLCPPSFAWLTTPQRDRIRGRHHLRSAGGAVERPVGQRAHLGVAALAGVLAHSVRKGDNLLKRLYEGAVKGAATVLAVGRARERPLRAQRAVSARRADEVV